VYWGVLNFFVDLFLFVPYSKIPRFCNFICLFMNLLDVQSNGTAGQAEQSATDNIENNDSSAPSLVSQDSNANYDEDGLLEEEDVFFFNSYIFRKPNSQKSQENKKAQSS
jgi:hypothetical protein